MSYDPDHDHRGPYAPSGEAPLAFDARRPQRGGGPAPVALIASVLVLALVVGGAFFIYRGGLRSPGATPRPVGAPIGDVRTAPPPGAQPVDPAAGLSVYKDDAPAAAPTFAPLPEAPGPRPAPAPLKPVAEAQPKPVTVVSPPPAPASAEVEKPVVAAAHPAKPVPPAPAKPVVAVAKPPPAPSVPTPAKPGAAVVQIGVYSSSAGAERAWNEAAGVAAGAMSGKGKKVETVDVDGATRYRVAVTGFATHDAAQGFCERLRSAGKTCFVK